MSEFHNKIKKKKLLEQKQILKKTTSKLELI